jgi:hypothetical protein
MADAQEFNIVFLNDILSSLSKSDEKELFAIQNTLYALLIFIQAGITEEAGYSKGKLAIDGKTYDAAGSIFPASLIADYGFWSGPEGYHLDTARRLFWPLIGIIMDEQADLLEHMSVVIEATFAEQPETNYYGSAMTTAQLEGEWLERAERLFGIVAEAAAAAAAAEQRQQPAKKAAVNYKQTRRTHGRRALTPPRSSRSTAYTRHNKNRTGK